MQLRSYCTIALTSLLASSMNAQSVTWRVDNVTNIGGLPVAKYGNPQVVSTPYGNAVQFNGINDGLRVPTNPLAGMTNMTVEMIFRHDPLTVPDAWQPRIVHIQATPTDHRLTLETRVNTNTTPHTFVLDTFLKLGNTAGVNNATLTNGSFPHPVGEWSHMAITYNGTAFKNYVNGREELSTNISGTTFATPGNTWIGQRSNNINYFQGQVLALRFTPRALATNEFMNVPATRLEVPSVSDGNAQLDFELTSGLPASFRLLQAANLAGPWSTNDAAVLTTNSPGISYRFTTATSGNSQFYRVQSP